MWTTLYEMASTYHLLSSLTHLTARLLVQKTSLHHIISLLLSLSPHLVDDGELSHYLLFFFQLSWRLQDIASVQHALHRLHTRPLRTPSPELEPLLHYFIVATSPPTHA